MISRDLSRRIERLERQLRPRIQDMTASDIDVFQRLYDIKKRLTAAGADLFLPVVSKLQEIVIWVMRARIRGSCQEAISWAVWVSWRSCKASRTAGRTPASVLHNTYLLSSK